MGKELLGSLELNRIYQMDCLEGMKLIPNESIDLIVTDPPYTMTKRGKSCRPNWMPNNMGENVFDGKIPDTQSWMEQCYRVLKNETHFYTFCNINDITKYLQVAKDVGFKLHNIIAMIKDTGMPNRWYYKQTELVLFFRKGKAKPINDFTSRDNINVIMPKQSTGKIHITQKPYEFIEKLVTNSSKENEVVLDPFMGSATTAVASICNNRKWVGFEVDTNNIELANKRLEQIQLEDDLADYEK
ncbi:DNA-methyltransferase [Bacillus vallismortis]|uniref:DNA-methyltransferase n=1 Tax=Bacillus vallismortis TaxID=72361 RepID=UPI00227F9668|nr:site-specific DNA-methyltransferase [Bacillus vallismortis]MCY8546629.1 site-specific DNA-methyltransferase [Bacillus vallismortis]